MNIFFTFHFCHRIEFPIEWPKLKTRKNRPTKRMLQMTSMLDNEPKYVWATEKWNELFTFWLEMVCVNAIVLYCERLIVAKRSFLYFYLENSCAMVHCRSDTRDYNYIAPCSMCPMSTQSHYQGKPKNEIKFNICFSIHFLYFHTLFLFFKNTKHIFSLRHPNVSSCFHVSFIIIIFLHCIQLVVCSSVYFHVIRLFEKKLICMVIYNYLKLTDFIFSFPCQFRIMIFFNLDFNENQIIRAVYCLHKFQ